MNRLLVRGGKKLNGEVRVSGSKNAALPIIAAALLARGKTVLKNVPDIRDIQTMLHILDLLHVKYTFENHALTLDSSAMKNVALSGDLISQMRASVLLLAPLLARFGKANISYPGGCTLGKRPVNVHLRALEHFGASCTILQKMISVRCKKTGLQGNDLVMEEQSVTATENVIIAAVTAKGRTVVSVGACEPHVQDLCRFLNKMGAKIKHIGSHRLVIDGVKDLKGTTYTVTGDYLEAGTMILAGLITRGTVTVKGFNPGDLDSFFTKLKQAGAAFKIAGSSATVFPTQTFKPVAVKTNVFPGLCTDLHPPLVALMTQAKGVTRVFETLFEGRLSYLYELEKLGAQIEVYNPHQALVVGPTCLKGAEVSSCDIRGGASVVLAALAAKGETIISDVNYLDRGHENFDEKLRKLGADIRRD